MPSGSMRAGCSDLSPRPPDPLWCRSQGACDLGHTARGSGQRGDREL